MMKVWSALASLRACSIMGAALFVLSGCQTQDSMRELIAGSAEQKPLLYRKIAEGPALGQVASLDGTGEDFYTVRLQMGVAKHPDLDKYLNDLLGKVQATLPTSPAPARIYITPEPTFTAFGQASGNIFIAHGMLSSLESEDEVVALIAHEYAHVLMEHYSADIISDLSGGLYGGATLYMMARHNQKGRMDDTLVRQALVNEAVLEFSSTGLIPSLSREQESQADRLGMDLLLRAGYSPVGMTALLDRMHTWEGISNSRKVERAERLSAFQAAEGEEATKRPEGTAASPQIPSFSAAFAAMLDHASQGVQALKAELSKKHDDAADRGREIAAYQDQFYADLDRPPLTVKPWLALKEKRHVKAFFEGMQEINDVAELLSGQSGKEALARARKVKAGAAGHLPSARNLLTRAEMQAGNRDTATALMRAAVQSEDSLWQEHERYIMYQLGESATKGREAAEASYDRLGSPQSMLPLMIKLYMRDNRRIQADMFLLSCIKIGKPDLSAECHKAYKGIV